VSTTKNFVATTKKKAVECKLAKYFVAPTKQFSLSEFRPIVFPVAPQVAGRDSVDCSFELDDCSWKPPPPAHAGGAHAGGAHDPWERVAVKTLAEGMRRQPHGPTLRNGSLYYQSKRYCPVLVALEGSALWEKYIPPPCCTTRTGLYLLD